MKLQNVSFQMASHKYSQVGTDANANNARVGKDNKTNKQQNTANALMSPNSNFDKMIEKIQEQIQKIQKNDRYDADTKKSKIEELEKQLQEIEKAKAEQFTESMLGQKKKPESNHSTNSVNGSSKDKSDSEGVILDLSVNAKALIEADNSLKNLKNAHSMKVKLEGSSNVLASEIKTDKGRGVDTTKKEEQLARLQEGVENSFVNMAKAIKDVNNTAQNISESTTSTVEVSSEKHTDENEESADATATVSANAPIAPATQEKVNDDISRK